MKQQNQTQNTSTHNETPLSQSAEVLSESQFQAAVEKLAMSLSQQGKPENRQHLHQVSLEILRPKGHSILTIKKKNSL
jgi:hypothetical protein